LLNKNLEIGIINKKDLKKVSLRDVKNKFPFPISKHPVDFVIEQFKNFDPKDLNDKNYIKKNIKAMAVLYRSQWVSSSAIVKNNLLKRYSTALKIDSKKLENIFEKYKNIDFDCSNSLKSIEKTR